MIRIIQIIVVGATCALLLSCTAGTESISVIPESDAIDASEGEGLVFESTGLLEGLVASTIGVPEQLSMSEGDNGLACVHPDGSRLVFQSNRDGSWQIYELNLDNGFEQQMIFSEFNDENPVWTNDGLGILFVSDRDGSGQEWEREIYLYDLATSEIKRLTENIGDDWYPATLSDGGFLYITEQFADAESPFYTRRAKVMRGFLDGTPSVTVIDSDLDATAPVEINPEEIVYRSTDGELMLYSSLTGLAESLTPEDVNCGSPCYDSNKGWLAFNSAVDGNLLYLVDMVGDIIQTIDLGADEVRYPQFTPDGTSIVYTAMVEGKFQLFKIDLAP